MVQTITVSGSVAGLQQSALGPQAPGVLTELFVDEGNRVERGDLVARVSSGVESAEVRRAEAAVQSARAQLDEALAEARRLPTQLEQAGAEVQGQVDEARERLNRARTLLEELQTGGTEQQRRQAQADLQQTKARLAQAQRDADRADRLADADATARAALERAKAQLLDTQASVQSIRAEVTNAEADYERAKKLYDQGALAEAEYDRAFTARQTAREQLNAAQARVSQAQVEVDRQQELLQTSRRQEAERAQTELEVATKQVEAAQARLDDIQGPARTEAIRRQEAEIRAAEAALKAAREAGSARIENVRKTPATERVGVARQRLEEAIRARDTALARLEQTDVTAPYSAVVTEIVNRPGTLVNSTNPILKVTEMIIPEVRVDVDERDLKQIQVGQKAVLVTDVYPERSVDAEVTEVAPRANTERGTVEVVCLPTGEAPWLKSGMTVDATIILVPQSPQIIVPATAVLSQREGSRVLIIDDGVVRSISVSLGSTCKLGTVVTSGLTTERLVVLDPLSVEAGTRVSPNIVDYPGGNNAL